MHDFSNKYQEKIACGTEGLEELAGLCHLTIPLHCSGKCVGFCLGLVGKLHIPSLKGKAIWKITMSSLYIAMPKYSVSLRAEKRCRSMPFDAFLECKMKPIYMHPNCNPVPFAVIVWTVETFVLPEDTPKRIDFRSLLSAFILTATELLKVPVWKELIPSRQGWVDQTRSRFCYAKGRWSSECEGGRLYGRQRGRGQRHPHSCTPDSPHPGRVTL